MPNLSLLALRDLATPDELVGEGNDDLQKLSSW